MPASEAGYARYHYQRVSRPVLVFRRWKRWFRKTWVGREFGWILDEVGLLLHFFQLEVADALAARRVKKFLSRRQNLGAVVVVVLALVAACDYGQPHYRRYVEQRYAGQAEQFMMKGDFARAYLRVARLRYFSVMLRLSRIK